MNAAKQQVFPPAGTLRRTSERGGRGIVQPEFLAMQRAAVQSATVQRLETLQKLADEQADEEVVAQRQAETSGGLPSSLKSGIENLSGMAMDDVRVHRNSSKPAEVDAHAFAQGSDIHLASGQEKHLPHEAWHVVQQKQGRVQPTMQMSGVAINDDPGLEAEADRMGSRAMQKG